MKSSGRPRLRRNAPVDRSAGSEFLDILSVPPPAPWSAGAQQKRRLRRRMQKQGVWD